MTVNVLKIFLIVIKFLDFIFFASFSKVNLTYVCFYPCDPHKKVLGKKVVFIFSFANFLHHSKAKFYSSEFFVNYPTVASRLWLSIS